MGVQVLIEVDPAPVLAILDSLSSPAFEKVAALAINDTLKNAQVQTAKVLAPAMGAKSADVKAALSIERARTDGLSGALVAKGKPIKLIKFRPRETRRGIAVRIGGKVDVFRRAFMPPDKRGVYERMGKARLPIRELYGPSVPGFLQRRDMLLPVQLQMLDRLMFNLRRQMERHWRKEQGHATATRLLAGGGNA